MQRNRSLLLGALLGSAVMTPLNAQPLSTASTIGDVLAQPAFQGFADRLLPWDDGREPRDLPLARVAALMPYHSHIRPAEIVATLNAMAARQARGEAVFFEMYSEAEQRREPGKRHTGLFLFKGRDNAPFVMIAPGGGFAYVGALHEGFPIAERVAAQGYNAFVVRYRAGVGGQAATQDMARAVAFVRENAAALKVSPDNYAVWGASAGARMAAALGSYGTQAFGEAPSRPISVIMLYTGHSDLNRAGETATFASVGADDGIAAPRVMRRRIEQLKSMGVPTKFHIYPRLAHGFALGTGTSAAGWEKDALAFWQKQITSAAEAGNPAAQ